MLRKSAHQLLESVLPLLALVVGLGAALLTAIVCLEALAGFSEGPDRPAMAVEWCAATVSWLVFLVLCRLSARVRWRSEGLKPVERTRRFIDEQIRSIADRRPLIEVPPANGTSRPARQLPLTRSRIDLYFSILGLRRRTATLHDVEEAFRRASLKNHPDKNKDDPFAEVRFRVIQEAYEVAKAALRS